MDNETSSRTTIIVFIIVIVTIIMGSALLLINRPDPVLITINPPVPTASPEPSGTPSPMLVYITGAVQNPETTLSLPYGSRVSDAIEAAGGISDGADLERVNLVAVLHDGDQVHVPRIGDTSTDEQADSLATPSGGQIVYINTASLEELQTLPGVGPSLAQNIIGHRDTFGPFTSMDDVDQVSGIGPALLETLEPLISFE